MNQLYRDFRDLAVIMLAVDGIGGILLFLIWSITVGARP